MMPFKKIPQWGQYALCVFILGLLLPQVSLGQFSITQVTPLSPATNLCPGVGIAIHGHDFILSDSNFSYRYEVSIDNGLYHSVQPSGASVIYDSLPSNLPGGPGIEVRVKRLAYSGITYINSLFADKVIVVKTLHSVVYFEDTLCADGQTVRPNFQTDSNHTFQNISCPLGFLQSNGDLIVGPTYQGTHSFSWFQNNCPNNEEIVEVTVLPPSTPAIFTYPTPILCKQSNSDPLPDNLSPNGGTFTSNTVALSPSTGQIYLGSSPLDTHTVTYTPGPGTCTFPTDFQVVIYDKDDPTFSYPSPICRLDGNILPDSPPIAGGIFKKPPGSKIELIDSHTGEINPLQSIQNPGTNYRLRYVTNGPCPDSSEVTLDIQNHSAEFYIPDTVCFNTGSVVAGGINSPGYFTCLNYNLNANPNYAGTPNANMADVSGVPQGQYIFQYNISHNGCVDAQQDTLFVTHPDPFQFSYLDTSVCIISNDLHVPVLNGNATPTGFWSDPPNGLGLNAANGAITAPACQLTQPYTIYCQINSNSCIDTVGTEIKVIPATPAILAYAPNNAVALLCQNMGLHNPLAFGPPGGTFSSTGGLPLDPQTGAIQTDSLAPGVYTVTYSPPIAECSTPMTSSIQVQSNQFSFGYLEDTICTSSGLINPIITGNGINGFFSSSTPGLNVNSASGMIDPSFNTTTGTYTVQFTSSNPLCPTTFFANAPITVNQPPTPSFSLPQTACKNQGSVSATGVSHPGGYFSGSFPVVIDSGGTIDLSQTPAGPYTITYTIDDPCPATAVMQINVLQIEVPNFTYPQARFCDNEDPVLPVPDSTSFLGGVYSCSDSGLAVSSFGVIDPRVSDPGFYTVVYNTAGSCPETFLDTIEIMVSEDATFDYLQYSNCDSNVVAKVDSGSFSVMGGRFLGDLGLIVDSITGVVDLLASTSGPHDIRYRTLGLCPDEFTDEIEIVPYDTSTSICYPADTFCNGGDPVVACLYGDSTGTFWASPGLIWLDQSSGTIDLQNTEEGPYSIQYSLNSACSENYSVEVEVLGQDSTDFIYSDWYCINVENPLPIWVASPGGIFSTNSNSIQIDSLTGEIDLLASIPGPYTIWYETNQKCPGTGTFSLELRPRPLSITYAVDPDTVICEGTEIQIISSPSEKVWFGINPRGLVDTTLIYTSPSFEDGDQVTIFHKNAYECLDSTKFRIEVNPYPTVMLGQVDGEIKGGDEISIPMASTVDYTNFFYHIGLNGSVATDKDSGALAGINAFQDEFLPIEVESFSDLDPGLITVYVEPEHKNCIGEMDSVVLRVNPEGIGIFIPGVMTPNGNGLNDSWLIQWTNDIDPAHYSIELFNRSMGKVLHMQPLNDHWQGEQLPDGIYHWILRDKNLNPVNAGGLTIRRK